MALPNPQVTRFLDELNHPFSAEIEALRQVILAAPADLAENIKWNAPNYTCQGQDRFTMRIMPPAKQVQLIFHRGAAKLPQPPQRFIQDDSGLLVWKENDRAIATFRSLAEIEARQHSLSSLLAAWVRAGE